MGWMRSTRHMAFAILIMNTLLVKAGLSYCVSLLTMYQLYSHINCHTNCISLSRKYINAEQYKVIVFR